jgi:hypothetical protein
MWVIPEDLSNFSPKKGEKSWGAKNSHLSASNFRKSPPRFCCFGLSQVKKNEQRFQGGSSQMNTSLAW